MSFRTKEEAIQKFSELAKRNYVTDYNVVLIKRSRKKTTVATCWAYRKVFEMVEFYALNLNDEDFTQVALHEVAHALTPGHGHDSTFRRAANKIGAISRRDITLTYLDPPQYLKPTKNFVYECPSCKKEYRFGRMLKKQRSCGQCSKSWNPNFVIVFKKYIG